jgi:hypothetical protein
MEGILPTAISNLIKPLRFASEDGIRTRRYDVITGDLTAGEIMSQMFGFAPERYIRQQEENRRVKNLDEATNKRATKLTKKYYLATRMGDWVTAKEVLEDIVKYNKEHPRFALSPKDIKKSMDGHMRTTQNMFNGVSTSKTMREILREQGDVTLGERIGQ